MFKKCNLVEKDVAEGNGNAGESVGLGVRQKPKLRALQFHPKIIIITDVKNDSKNNFMYEQYI